MRSGAIRTTGPVGRHAAAGMSGGRLDVAGDAGEQEDRILSVPVVREQEALDLEVEPRRGHHTVVPAAGHEPPKLVVRVRLTATVLQIRGASGLPPPGPPSSW